MKSPDRPTEPTLIVAVPISFLAQPTKFSPASPSISGNFGSQNQRCEQCRMSMPAYPSGASQSAIACGDLASRAVKPRCFHWLRHRMIG